MKTKIIIISIHPQHINKILSGEKLYEYRRRIPLDIKYIVIYATVPIKKVVAIVEVDCVIKDTPIALWNLTYRYSGISYDFFMNYFYGLTEAHAIKFANIYKLGTPVDIAVIDGIRCAPQAYSYVNESFEVLCDKFNIELNS